MKFAMVVKEVKLMAGSKQGIIRVDQYLANRLVRATSHQMSQSFSHPNKYVSGIWLNTKHVEVRT